ncbi:MAG: cation-transporting P-type ATPase [Terriglobales bacterium]|jgi:magnesium-transporting ATPase (P-type)
MRPFAACFASAEDGQPVYLADHGRLYRKPRFHPLPPALKTRCFMPAAQKRLTQYGPNEIEGKKTNPFLKFLTYFWGPIPWMIEAAVILSGVVRHWLDFLWLRDVKIFTQ